MSETGYQVLSKHFSTYVGQVQLTNHTWESEYSPIFTSTPSFLHGMKLYPENIGYISGDDPNAIANMKKKALDISQFSDGAIAGFYHPYLGFDRLKKLVTALESVPDAEWLDLKAQDNQTDMGKIRIQSSEGKLDVKKDTISSSYEKQVFLARWLPKILAIIAIAGLIIFLIARRRSK